MAEPETKSYLDFPFEVKAEDISEDGTFKGYGSLFVKNPDAHGDIIAPGAFTKTLSQGGRNKTGIAMLWQHRSDQIPGVWQSLTEDSKGLATAGKLAVKTRLGSDVYEIMKLAAELKTFNMSMSIGYDPIEYEIDEKKKIRTLKEINLWEISIVTFPARLGATITQVKSIEDAKTERELEEVLRESGLSKSAALYVVKLCKPSLRESADGIVGPELLSGILDSLKEVNCDVNDFVQTVTLQDSLRSIHI